MLFFGGGDMFHVFAGFASMEKTNERFHIVCPVVFILVLVCFCVVLCVFCSFNVCSLLFW